MPICGIVGCSNRKGVKKDVSFFKVPKILTDQGEETIKLSEERRRLWKSAINRKDIATEERWERTLVCSKHFVGSVKAYLHDRTSPSWLPTLDLGYTEFTSSVIGAAHERFNRASQRKYKRKISDAVTSLITLKKRCIDFGDNNASGISEYAENTEIQNDSACNVHKVMEHGSFHSAYLAEETSKAMGIQTDLTVKAIKQLEDDNKSRVIEAKKNEQFDFKGLYNLLSYADNSEQVSFYTRLPNYGVLKLVFNLIEGHMSNNSKSLSKENEFLLCLVKLRMNYLFQDITNHLTVSLPTVQRSFHNTLDVLYIRLGFLVQWSIREHLRETMPMCFRKEFGEKVVVVLDCFELFTERPSGALNKVYTYSNYKHNQTVKYLIGIAPQGVVTFISDGWGGRTSDKYITEKSGLLNNLLPGDIVMVDRGFNIEDAVRFYQAELAIPTFTRGKTQLHPLEVEKTRKTASVRIHVERVIGLVLRKFRIFESIVPIEFIKLKHGESVPTIDKIVKVACCLTNLCPSVVPFE